MPNPASNIKSAVKDLAYASPLGQFINVMSKTGEKIEDTYEGAKKQANRAAAYAKGYLKSAKPKPKR